MRIEYPGALYHVITRGNCSGEVYHEDDDRYRFLEILNDTVKKFKPICHSYCMMTNHYHMLLETPDGNLSSCIHRLNSVYANYFNRKYDRIGHLFQGRFKAIVVQKESYLLELCRYIVLNPVRAHMVDEPGDYKWSSYRYTVSLRGDPIPFLSSDWILAQFDEELSKAREKYIKFVYDGMNAESPMNDVIADLVLGDEDFIEFLKEKTSIDMNDIQIPIEQRYLFRKRLCELFSFPKALNKEYRNKMIIEAYNNQGYTQNDISSYLNLSRKTVSRVLRSGFASQYQRKDQ